MVDKLFLLIFYDSQVKSNLNSSGDIIGLHYGCAEECTPSNPNETGGSYTPMGGNATAGPLVQCCNYNNCNDNDISKTVPVLKKSHQINLRKPLNLKKMLCLREALDMREALDLTIDVGIATPLTISCRCECSCQCADSCESSRLVAHWSDDGAILIVHGGVYKETGWGSGR